MRPWLEPHSLSLLQGCTRRQGWMLAASNPLKIYEPEDLAQPTVRFINRQRGSSPRLLLDV